MYINFSLEIFIRIKFILYLEKRFTMLKRFRKKETHEKTTYSTTNSRKLYLPIYLMIFILLAIIFFIRNSGKTPNDIVLIATGIFIAISLISTELHRLSNRYEIDQNHIIHNQGILKKNSKRIFIPTISDLILNQSPLQRLLKFGTLEVHRFSEGSSMNVKHISNPKKFLEILEKKMNTEETKSPFKT